MAAIEEHLHRHFASVQDGHAGESEITEGRSTTAQSDLATVFARVNTVAPGGPADRAGLRPGDQIRTFGYANSTNHDNLKKVAECVQANQGVGNPCALGTSLVFSGAVRANDCLCIQRSVLVNVSRSTGDGVREELRLTLVPVQGWGGRGMLGCHLLPI
jgi:26S proteasome non-ATPase regulatory subunit 9